MTLVTFCPYILIETAERRPSSLSTAAWTGNQHRYLRLDASITDGDLDHIKKLVRKSHRENGGICFNYGAVIGYRVALSPTESILLDISGNIVRRQRGLFWPRTITPRVEA